MRVWVLVGVAAILLVGGCTSSPPTPRGAATASPSPAASAPPWAEPANYGFVLERRCAGAPSKGVYRVSVRGGKVTEADRIDGKTAQGEEEIDVPTLGELLEMGKTAEGDGAAVTTTFDAADGHPTGLTIDAAGDGGRADASCFTVTDYVPAG